MSALRGARVRRAREQVGWEHPDESLPRATPPPSELWDSVESGRSLEIVIHGTEDHSFSSVEAG